MKKIVSAIMSFVMALSALSFSATSFAAPELDTYIENDFILMYTNTHSITMGICNASNGVYYECNVMGKSNTTKISVNLTLQEYYNNKWNDVDSVYKSVDSNSNTTGATYTSAVSGRKYRCVATVYSYVGLLVETIPGQTSATITRS